MKVHSAKAAACGMMLAAAVLTLLLPGEPAAARAAPRRRWPRYIDRAAVLARAAPGLRFPARASVALYVTSRPRGAVHSSGSRIANLLRPPSAGGCAQKYKTADGMIHKSQVGGEARAASCPARPLSALRPESTNTPTLLPRRSLCWTSPP
jgi:hypothetical protein